jgi:hypothetical protein
MKLVLQYFAGCPNWQELEELVLAIMAERNDIELRTQAIATAEEAVEHEFRRSPTLLVDGNDPFASQDAKIGSYLPALRYAQRACGKPEHRAAAPGLGPSLSGSIPLQTPVQNRFGVSLRARLCAW